MRERRTLLVVGAAPPETLFGSAWGPFTVRRCDTLADAANQIADAAHDGLLLYLPTAQDTHRLLAWPALSQACLDAAVLMVTDHPTPALATELLERGVQDVLVTATATPDAIARALHLAIGRKQIDRAARKAYATDLATGLPNETQLPEHMSHLLALREREPAPMALMVVRVEGLVDGRGRRRAGRRRRAAPQAGGASARRAAGERRRRIDRQRRLRGAAGLDGRPAGRRRRGRQDRAGADAAGPGRPAVGGRGQNIYAGDVDETEVRKRVGLLAQRPATLPMSIYDNVAFGMRVHRMKKNRLDYKSAVQHYLQIAGLWDEVKKRLHDPATSLSIGQQQRLCLARGLAVEPEIILGDEPTSALDPLSSQNIEGRLLDLKKEYTTVIVTHTLRQAKRLADYVVYMYLGEVIEAGPANEVFNNPKHERTRGYLEGQF